MCADVMFACPCDVTFTSSMHFAAVGAWPGLVTKALMMQDDAVSSDRVQGSVLEPCRSGVEMKMNSGTGDFNLSLSDLKLDLAPDIFELVQSLQSSVLEPLLQPNRSEGHGILPNLQTHCCLAVGLL